MNIPKIDSVYNYNGNKVIVWQQDLFKKVYLRTVPKTETDKSIYFTENWWKFMRKSKYLKSFIKNNTNY